MHIVRFAAIGATALLLAPTGPAIGSDDKTRIEAIVDAAIQPIMEEYAIPGMAVAVTRDGQKHYFNYGVASKEDGHPVTEETLFEIGSVSKLFTATLGAYAQATGALSLTDVVSDTLPSLAGGTFDDVTLLELATYTAGGLPLQFPDTVKEEALLDYYRDWAPAYPAGTQRLYSNPSIGLFGLIAAQRLGTPFDTLMEQKLFPMLGMPHSYTNVPDDRQRQYAYGYSGEDEPIRVNPGVLDSQAYGVKTTATDMLRFVELNIDAQGQEAPLQQALATTQTGYYRVDGMVQALGWERYPYPVELEPLLEGNSTSMALEAHEADRLSPPLPPQDDMWLNKTGSTNGFGTYVALVPAQRTGIVMLANKRYPNEARVKAAYAIMTALEQGEGSGS